MDLRGIILLVFIMISIGNTYAQAPVEIKGTLSSDTSKRIKLFSVLEGGLEEVSAFTIKEDGSFRFLFYPEYEGFYVLGVGTTTAPSHNATFYFKAGDKLDLSMTDTSYVLKGKLNSKENQIMSEWFERSFKVKQKSLEWMKHYLGSTFVDFFPDLEELSQGSKEFILKCKSGNPRFDKALPLLVKWDLASYAVSYLFSGRRVHPTVGQYPPAINNINAINFTKSAGEVYSYPYGRRNVKLVTMLEAMKSKQQVSESNPGLNAESRFILNDTLKGDQVLDYLYQKKDRRNFSETVGKYGKYIVTPRQKKVLATYESQLSPFKPGDKGFEFSFPDINEQVVKLGDLKGKIVVVDVWATWCGPCKQEIPHLEKLAGAFKGKDVAFVSISTDQQKDKAKWLQMIKDDQMGGIQLYGGNGNPFSKYYQINTIPRFLVFDKGGKLVTADGPRPSDPKLKLIIEEELNKGI